MWLLACTASEDGSVRAPPSGQDTADTSPDGETSADTAGDTSETSSPPTPGGLTLTWAPFPYVEVGDPVPGASLEVRNEGETPHPFAWRLTGPFEVVGEAGELAAGEARRLEVRWPGDTTEPTVVAGELEVEDNVIPLAVVVGDPALGVAPWTEDAWGARVTLDLPSAPFAEPGAPYGDASVLLAVPTGWDPTVLHTVTHFHGHNATIAEVDEDQSLHVQHALSGRDAVLVVPQGPVEAADSDFGQLDEAGGHARLLRDVVSVLYRDGYVRSVALGDHVLTAHSGGYNVTANVLDAGGLPITAVHLFDALYAREDVYADFVAGGGRFRSVYTSGGGTDDNNEALRRSLERDGVEVCDALTDEALAACTVNIAWSSASHGGCVSETRAFARWLAGSGLPPADEAAPTLLYAGPEDVRWRDEGVEVVVERSKDGVTWTTGAGPYVRVRQPGGAPSDVYYAEGDDWLVVDGFDRVLGGSWTAPTHDFAATVAAALPGGASVAWHEAVAEGDVRLDDYARVLWLLGDESTADFTFDDREQAALAGWAGEQLVLSGSEIGYADDGWLASLGVSYVADDAGTDRVEAWTVGDRYPEDYPDVLAGPEVLWRWSTGGGAAVRSGDVVVVGFGLENLSPEELAAAVGDLAE